MKKFFLVLYFLLHVSVCHAWVETYNEFYQQKVEPKLDIIFETVMEKANKIISTTKPFIEVQLTEKERFFSESSMEFFGYDCALPQHSGVIWLAVWVDNHTIIKGWAKKDRYFHASYIYTQDPRLVFASGVRVGIDTSVLEKFFNAPLYDISAGYGSLAHLQEILPNDDWGASTVFISYDNGLIKSIAARDDYVPNDVVPMLPKSAKVDDFINKKVEELSLTSGTTVSGLTFDQKLTAIRNRNFQRSINELTPDDTIAMSISKIVILIIFFLLCGVLLCLLFVMLGNNFTKKPTTAVQPYECPDDEVIDAIFVDEPRKEKN